MYGGSKRKNEVNKNKMVVANAPGVMAWGLGLADGPQMLNDGTLSLVHSKPLLRVN